MNFLAVRWKTVIDTPAVDAVEDADGNEITPAVAEVSHEEIDSCYVEDDAATVARNLANPEIAKQFEYYEIETGERGAAVLHRVKVKGTKPAPAREVAEIESNGAVVGEAEV